MVDSQYFDGDMNKQRVLSSPLEGSGGGGIKSEPRNVHNESPTKLVSGVLNQDSRYSDNNNIRQQYNKYNR